MESTNTTFARIRRKANHLRKRIDHNIAKYGFIPASKQAELNAQQDAYFADFHAILGALSDRQYQKLVYLVGNNEYDLANAREPMTDTPSARSPPEEQ